MVVFNFVSYVTQHLALECIFLYNSETWGTTKEEDNKTDTFQRRLLQNILGIKKNKRNWLNNDEV